MHHKMRAARPGRLSIRPMIRLAVTLVLLSLFNCAPGHAVQGRPYELEVPDDAGSAPLPLVILLHGYSGNGFAQNFIFPFSGEVDSHRFLYALPDGTRDAVGKRFWNASDACCNFGKLQIDDVGFLRALIADVKASHAVDPARIFLIGHSNGGFMALRMACEASDLVTGVVSIAGAAALPMPSCPGPAIPVLQIHGTADETIPYLGGNTGALGAEFPSAIVTAQGYATRNGCSEMRTAADPLDLVGDSTTETTRDVFDGCPAKARVELWTVDGATHLPAFNSAWPGRVIDWLQESVK